MLCCLRTVAAGARPPSVAMPSRRCSVLMNSSFSRSASACAASVTLRKRGERAGSVPYACGWLTESRPDERADLRRIHVHLSQHLGDDTTRLLDERQQQVLGLDLRVREIARELLGAHDGFLSLFSELVDVHGRSSRTGGILSRGRPSSSVRASRAPHSGCGPPVTGCGALQRRPLHRDPRVLRAC